MLLLALTRPILFQPAAEVKTKPTMFQSGKTTFVKGGNSVTSSPAATSSTATPTTVSTKTVATPKHVLRNTVSFKLSFR